jgi:hypothetical protein
MIIHARTISTTLPLLALVACVKQLPPAPTPAPIAPALPATAPPAQGQGRLVIDVTDGPAPVKRIVMDAQPIKDARGFTRYRLGEAPALLCNPSPCLTDLPVGTNIVLGFPVIGDSNETEVELVHVGPDPSVYRRALSEYHDDTGATRVLGIIATSLGSASAITGAALLPIGLSKDNNTMTTAGGITLGAGALAIVLGILAIRADSPTYRPGSSNHYPL